jgi:hypothetical protein
VQLRAYKQQKWKPFDYTNQIPPSLSNISLLGHPLAQLFEAPRYKPEGRGFDSRWCLWDFY